MSRVRAWARRVRWLLHPEQTAREIDEEMRLHIDLETEKYLARGLDPVEARRRARIEFGAFNSVQEELRAGRSLAAVQNAALEIRYALRILRRSPVLAGTAALTLAIGVGASTAVFGIIDATVFRPLPFPRDDRLLELHKSVLDRAPSRRDAVWSYPEYIRIVAALQQARPDVDDAAVGLAAWHADDMDIAAGDGVPLHTTAEIVSAGYFDVLGIDPVAGRTFAPDEDALVGSHPVAVLRSGVAGGAADAAVGTTVVVSGVALTVIGVMPASFRGLSGSADVWVTHAIAPLVYFRDHLNTEDSFLRIVGRLESGASLEDLQARLAFARSLPDAEEQWSTRAVALKEARRDAGTVRAQAALAGAALLLLLIAVVNFSGLLLARAHARSREMALRCALGASRGRVVRTMLIESGLIGLAGGGIGIWIAMFATGPIAGAVRLDALAPAQLDWRTVVFAAALSLCCGVAAGVIPALRSSRRDVALTLGRSSRTHTAGAGSIRRPTLLSAIAIVQFASALVLLVGAGVLLDRFRQLTALDPGIRADSLITFRISPPSSRYEGAAAVRLLSDVLEHVAAVPGVRSATVGRCLPGTDCSYTPLYRPGIPDDEAPIVRRHYVGPDHFSTLGIPLVRGRLLTDGDRAGNQRVAVINEYAARRLWPGQDPLGRRVWFGSGGGFASPDSMTEIVGVVADVRYGVAGSEPEPDFYTSYQQYVLPETMVIVRASAGVATLLPALRAAVAGAARDVAIHDVRTPRQISRDAMATKRTATVALALFAATGLFLAAVGVYGLLSWSVAQRRREIGIRLAVGASPRRIRSEVVRDGISLAAAGMIIGGFASFGFARTLSAFIPGLDNPDVRILAVVSAMLMIVALITCLVPARSASRVDPCTSLSTD